MDTIAADLGTLKDERKKLADKVYATEVTLTELVPQQTLNTDTTSDLQRWIQQHDHVEDAEGWAQLNNVRIVGMPEGEEGTNPTQFIEEWFRSAVAPQGLLPIFVIQRAPLCAFA
ncbi:hypothetical protein NDU88_000549 [Pleurodeles waltl]|uniref:Uncharacterized protein n=1 Tax=Pleurodeles waltl TaxID=8319 RepID=A0AAV7VTU8_PLEWA|nr:hypothetical protein NDU88_000549 [Pleurodeles waltl]